MLKRLQFCPHGRYFVPKTSRAKCCWNLSKRLIAITVAHIYIWRNKHYLSLSFQRIFFTSLAHPKLCKFEKTLTINVIGNIANVKSPYKKAKCPVLLQAKTHFLHKLRKMSYTIKWAYNFRKSYLYNNIERIHLFHHTIMNNSFNNYSILGQKTPFMVETRPKLGLNVIWLYWQTNLPKLLEEEMFVTNSKKIGNKLWPLDLRYILCEKFFSKTHNTWSGHQDRC